MRTSLGVACSRDEILLAVAHDGRVVSGFPEKLAAANLIEQSERLSALVEDVRRVIAEAQPDVVRVLMPEHYRDSYERIAPRVALETLVRLAAVEMQVPVEMLARATARSRLRLPRSGWF